MGIDWFYYISYLLLESIYKNFKAQKFENKSKIRGFILKKYSLYATQALVYLKSFLKTSLLQYPLYKK